MASHPSNGHILCTDEQVGAEVATFCKMLAEVYADFGFGKDKFTVKLATRPEQRIGDDAGWDRAEEALSRARRRPRLHRLSR